MGISTGVKAAFALMGGLAATAIVWSLGKAYGESLQQEADAQLLYQSGYGWAAQIVESGNPLYRPYSQN